LPSRNVSVVIDSDQPMRSFPLSDRSGKIRAFKENIMKFRQTATWCAAAVLMLTAAAPVAAQDSSPPLPWNYRPQFYFFFGPLSLTQGEVLEICAADASGLSGTGTPPGLDSGEVAWSLEVHDTDVPLRRPPLGPVKIEWKVEEGTRGGCFPGVEIVDLVGSDGTLPESMTVMVAVILWGPPGSKAIPVATGRLRGNGGDTWLPAPVRCPKPSQTGPPCDITQPMPEPMPSH
jgi:hypothetical protein